MLRALDNQPGQPWAHLEPNHQIQVLSSAFYRNKAAYVVGKIINGYEELPFVVPVLNEAGQLVLDAIVLEEEQLNILFSLSRAYFMVDMAVPSGYVKFLRRMMPTKARAELYTMLGLGRQGKTLFYRDLRQHLLHSQDTFVPAPGIQGQVMLVFTLPSYPYVFKVIKDVFGPSKETDRATVEAKFALVKHVDRVGRMADTLEFTDLALPRNRFSTELLDQLDELAPSMVENDDPLVIRHCYVERRMIPLNIYLDRATPAQLESAVRDYGNAIRDLAIANIFPGDMLWRNFGVTRHNRIVFYDYDEIEYLTDINFRRIPPPRTPKPSSLPNPGTPSPDTTSSPRNSPPSSSATQDSATHSYATTLPCWNQPSGRNANAGSEPARSSTSTPTPKRFVFETTRRIDTSAEVEARLTAPHLRVRARPVAVRETLLTAPRNCRFQLPIDRSDTFDRRAASGANQLVRDDREDEPELVFNRDNSKTCHRSAPSAQEPTRTALPEFVKRDNRLPTTCQWALRGRRLCRSWQG